MARSYWFAVILLVVLGVLSTAPADAALGYEHAVATPADLNDPPPGQTAGNETVGSNTTRGVSESVPNRTELSHHRKLSTVRERGDLEDVKRWLRVRLTRRLNESLWLLHRGEYEAARQELGGPFSEYVGMYDEIADETQNRSDDRQVKNLENASRLQQRYIESVSKYHVTKERYLEAKLRGNASGANRLADELDELQQDVNRTGIALERHYDNNTDVSRENATEWALLTRQVRRNVTAFENHAGRQFIETSLEARADASEASYLKPVDVTGRLTADGDPVVNRSVRFRVGEQTVWSTTNADGEFTLTIRPLQVSPHRSSLTLWYYPVNDSRHLGSRDRLATTVSQVTPDVEASVQPSTVGYNDSFTVTGSVTADERAVGDVPVEVYLGEKPVGYGWTTDNGTFSIDTRVPMTVESGELPLRVTLPLRDSAIAQVNETVPVRVRPATSAVWGRFDQHDQGSVHVTGRLTTADGTPIPNQSVVFVANGRSIASLKTDPAGWYAATINLPSNAVPKYFATTIEVAIVFPAQGTVFEPSQTSSSLELEPTSSSIVSELLDDEPLWLGVGGTLYGVVLLLMVNRLRGEEGEIDGSGSSVGLNRPGELESDRPGEARQSPVRLLRDVAREYLEDGRYGEAVAVAYAAARFSVSATGDFQPELTHWEFFEEHQDELDEDEREAFESLTEQYERTAFSSESASRELAAELIEDTSVLGDDEG